MLNLRCYGELNDYLPAGNRHRLFTLFCDDRMQVIDVIENLRIPPQEVVLVLVNDQPVDTGYQPVHCDRISLFPLFRSILSPVTGT